ncbi:MAG: hypothetical protein HWN65_01690 [Candidatus Helarchaeota archaeon]|nr:hypothetical protein [Candidatus Helarchaeota archaeon]
MPTIAVSEDVKRKLNLIKNKEGYKNVNEILDRMILLYEKTMFLKASRMFQEKLRDKKLDIADLSNNTEFKMVILGE